MKWFRPVNVGRSSRSHGNSRNSSFLLQCRRFAPERWQFSRDNGSCFDWFFWHHRGQLIFVGVSGRNSKNNGLRTGALFFSFPRVALRAKYRVRPAWLIKRLSCRLGFLGVFRILGGVPGFWGVLGCSGTFQCSWKYYMPRFRFSPCLMRKRI